MEINLFINFNSEWQLAPFLCIFTCPIWAIYCHWSFEMKVCNTFTCKTFIEAGKTVQSGVLSKLSKDEYINKRLPKCTSVLLFGKNYRPVQSDSKGESRKDTIILKTKG